MKPPDGIRDEHAKPHTGLRKHASPATILVLGIFLAAAGFGAFGKSGTVQGSSEGAALLVESPSRIRNGQLAEMRIHVRAEEPIDTLVIRVGTDLWKDMTVNTLLPAANEESMKDGDFEFTFGALPAGEDWMMKVSLQINPNLYGLNRGTIRVLDRDEELAAADVRIQVLP